MIEFKQEGHGLHHHLSYKSQVMFHPFLHCTSTSYIKGETFKDITLLKIGTCII